MAEIIYIDSNEKNIIKGEVYKNDTRTAELYGQSGIAHIPEKDCEGVLTYIGKGRGNGIIIANINRDAPEPSEPGETIIYSIKNGTIKSKTTYKTDGTVRTENDNGYTELKPNGDIEINGSADFAVAYNDLKSKIDELGIKLDAHVHGAGTLISPPTGGPVTGATGAPAASLKIDISGSKVNTVKLP